MCNGRGVFRFIETPLFVVFVTKIPLTQTLSRKGRGNFPSLACPEQRRRNGRDLREGDLFSWSFVSLRLMRVYSGL